MYAACTRPDVCASGPLCRVRASARGAGAGDTNAGEGEVLATSAGILVLKSSAIVGPALTSKLYMAAAGEKSPEAETKSSLWGVKSVGPSAEKWARLAAGSQ